MELRDGSKKIEIPNVKKVSRLGKGFGLMFRRREKSPALLFEFNNKPVLCFDLKDIEKAIKS